MRLPSPSALFYLKGANMDKFAGKNHYDNLDRGGEDDAERLSWRQDPVDSLSDYTIVVCRASDGDDTTTAASPFPGLGMERYHVHRVVLAVGSRKSRYFERMFKSMDDFLESRNGESHITLHPLAADMFPRLLDYMYFQSFPLTLDTYSATPLHFLSDYFDIRSLRKDVEVFCQFDLSPTNCHIYYTHASVLNDVSMQALVLRVCVEQSSKVSRNRDVFRVAPVEFWVKALELKAGSQSPTDRVGSSDLVEALLRAKADSENREDVTPDLFGQLTDPSRLPRIDTATCALAILTWEQHLSSDNNASSRIGVNSSLSSLQRRCVEALGRVLVTEVPPPLQGQWQTFIFAAVRDCGIGGSNGPLYRALVAQVVETGIESVSQNLKAALSFPGEAASNERNKEAVEETEERAPGSLSCKRRRHSVDE